MPFLSKLLLRFLLLLLLATASLAQRGAIVQPVGLADLTDRAQTIVRAQVVGARVEPHPQLKNLQTVVLTLAVKEAYKGNPASSMTIRQFIWDIRDKMDSMGYRKGQEYILFLNPPTRYGLTSTTGLDQGRFCISTDSAGREVVENGVRNYGLVAGSNSVEWTNGSSTSHQNASRPEPETQNPVSTAPQTAGGKIPVTDFVNVIKNHLSRK
jgi:hypothetical protein